MLTGRPNAKTATGVYADMKRLWLAALIAIGTALSATPALAQVYGGIYVRFGPPAPVYQPVPPPPAPYYAWVPGFYRWDDGRYVWVRGYYARPPYPGAYWAPGYWAHRREGWYFVRGRWERHERHGDDR
jgi:hypothetical protein